MNVRKLCIHCDKPSLPGLAPRQGLCQYHYNVLKFGREWADKLRAGTAKA